MLGKLFQRYQPLNQLNQNQEQDQLQQQQWQSVSPVVQRAYPMSRTAQWVAQQAHQEYRLVQPRAYRQQQQRQYEQEYHTYHTPDWQAPQHTSRRRKSHKTPLMDLSSLEGPPIEDPRLVNTPQHLTPRVREEPATPSSQPPCLLWKPLPPRPASAEPQSSRRLRLDIPRTESRDYFSDRNRTRNLGRGQVQMNRRNTFEDELFLNQGHPPGPAPAPAPAPAAVPAALVPGPSDLPTTNNIPQLQTSRPRCRSQNSNLNSLFWLEDEEQWVISHTPPSRSSHPPPSNRPPTRLRNATIRPPRPLTDVEVRGPNMDISVLGGEDVEWVGLGVPPDYESHQFSPTHVQRLTYGPASSGARLE